MNFFSAQALLIELPCFFCFSIILVSKRRTVSIRTGNHHRVDPTGFLRFFDRLSVEVSTGG
ncbi:hypothetical protein C462_10832 [Halorubrum distributum JCM 13916]|uniref:Uncharacterized protein n=1 Tax=Halorubrum distributum JCM 13916 TaxID=1230455 RepID=M0PJT1_9EURY|nr:hypothetical protein C462_10832 [Halorubrum arcis JCM 13916]